MTADDDQRPPSNPLERLADLPPASERYRDDGEFARGGMGSIRRIWDGDLRRILAMKVLLDAQEAGTDSESQSSEDRRIARFLEEAQVTAQLEHPGIIPVHELGLDERGQVFFTMPLVDGDDLSEILKKVHEGHEQWTPTRAVGVLLKVCEAMGFAHSRKVVHRDLKPANIMVGAHGEVYVMDWGLARVLDREDVRDLRIDETGDAKPRQGAGAVQTERFVPGSFESSSPLRTLDGEVVGTPAYMSPEQARGELSAVGPASDVYSLGSILYHLLSGAMPFAGASTRMSALEVWNRVKEGSPDPLAQVASSAPEELVAICERAMARLPEQRYADTTEMGEDLRAYLEGRVVRAHATGAWAEFRKWVGRNRELAGTVAAAIVVSFGALGWAAWNQAQANAKLGRANSELGEANGNLTSANEELAKTNTELDAARLATEARRQEADEATNLAMAASAEAQRRAYAAQLAVAALHLDQRNMSGLRRSLEGAPAHLRNWEWRHLALQQERSLLEFDLAGGGAHKATWFRDGRSAIAVGMRGSVGVFDALSGELQLASREHGWTVTSVAVSPDGRRFVTGSRDGQLYIWDLAVSRAPRRMSLGEFEVSAMAWSPNGERIAVGLGDRYSRTLGVESVSSSGPPKIVILDRFGSPLRTIAPNDRGHVRRVSDLAFLPDGRRLVTVSDDFQALVWDLETGELLEDWTRHKGPVWACDVSPSGALVTSGKEDYALLWAPDRKLSCYRLEGHAGSIYDVAFSPDGERIATAGADGTVRLYSAREHPGDGNAHSPLAVIRGHSGPVVSVEFDPSGERILSAGWEDGVRVWEAQTSGPVARIDAGDARLSSLSLGYRRGGGWQASPLAWLTLPGFSGEEPFLVGADASASKDGSRILHLGQVRRLRKTFAADLWDGRSGEHQVQLLGHSRRITALALAPDGKLAATGSADETVRLWNGESGLLTRVIGNMRAEVGAMAFDLRGERLAIGTAEGRVLIHDLKLGVATECAGRHQGAVTALSWSANGEQLASGGSDDLIRLWHGRSGRALAELYGHASSVTALAYHPSGRRLASGGRDRTVRIWDPETGDGLLTFPQFEFGIQRLGFAQNGRRLIVSVASEKPSLLVFDSSLLDARELWQSQPVAAQPGASGGPAGEADPEVGEGQREER